MGKEDVVNYDGAQLAEEGKKQCYLFTFCFENRVLFPFHPFSSKENETKCETKHLYIMREV